MNSSERHVLSLSKLSNSLDQYYNDLRVQELEKIVEMVLISNKEVDKELRPSFMLESKYRFDLSNEVSLSIVLFSLDKTQANVCSLSCPPALKSSL